MLARIQHAQRHHEKELSERTVFKGIDKVRENGQRMAKHPLGWQVWEGRTPGVRGKEKKEMNLATVADDMD